jgi:hypothetical protein
MTTLYPRRLLRALIKFAADYRWHRQHGRTCREAWQLAGRTL